MKTLFVALCVLACVALAGCVAGYVNPDLPISPVYMSQRLQYRGFSMARPARSAWYVIASEQSPPHAILRRRLIGKTHTAFVSVELNSLPRAAISATDFAELCRRDHVGDTNRLTMLSYDQQLATVQGQWAIEYEAIVADSRARKSPGEPLTMRMAGRVINHPSFSNSVVIIMYSERGLQKELDRGIETEGKQLMNGVLLESEPGKPLQ